MFWTIYAWMTTIPLVLSSLLDHSALDSILNEQDLFRRDTFGDVVGDASSSGVKPLGSEASSNSDGIAPGKPLGNAAIWQEALDNDARINSTSNRWFYGMVASLQFFENSSHTIATTQNPDPVTAASLIGQGLQYLNMYPCQFDEPQASNPAASLVQISPTPQQTIKSFGASGAWWPNMIKDFPESQQRNLSQLLFSEDGLQLSGYRYNMGGGGDQDKTTVSTPNRGVESFMKTDGSYDWARDSAGIYFLKAAEEANVSSIVFFVNAAPSAITTNKNTCRTDLTEEMIPPLTEYIIKVLSYWSGKGIHIDYISPMNEPDNSFAECRQEGMSVSPALRSAVFHQLRTSLQTSANPTVKSIKIIGDETSQVTSQALREYPQWLPQTLQNQSIDAVGIHMYDWPDDATLLNYRQLILNTSTSPPPIKMTEISSFQSARDIHKSWGRTGPGLMTTAEYDPSIDSALDMARFIWQWLTLVNAESWDWWTAVSDQMPCSPSRTLGCASSYVNGSGWNDAFIYIDPEYKSTRDYNFYLVKRFWVFRHFTTFYRPGAVRYDIPNSILPYGTVAVAAVDGDDVWSATFVNRNATEQGIKMKVPREGMQVVTAVQTTEAEDWGSVTLPVVAEDGTFGITLPARGVVTLRFKTADSATSGSRGARRRRRRR
ncbi:MAG: hypothetical protein Q9219_003962 [cf. Caloplaca sp. 3 TL-2023]